MSERVNNPIPGGRALFRHTTEPHRPPVLPDLYPMSRTASRNRTRFTSMCVPCLTGLHACHTEDCSCTCNDHDFPYPPTPQMLEHMRKAQAKGRIPGFVRL